MSRERNEQIMSRYLNEVLIQKKIGVIKEIANEDMWDHTSPKPGRDGLERHAGGFVGRMQNLRITVNHISATEDTAVGLWTWCGSSPGPFLGIPAGREFECNVCTIFKMRNGLVADYQLFCVAKTTSPPVQIGGMTNVISP